LDCATFSPSYSTTNEVSDSYTLINYDGIIIMFEEHKLHNPVIDDSSKKWLFLGSVV
jgi:hypothetical protein